MNAFHLRANSLVFMGAGTVLAVFLAILRAPAADWALDGLAGVAALVGVAVTGTRLALGTPSHVIRRLWQFAFALMLIASASAFTGPWVERIETRLGIDDLKDALVLIAVFAMLWVASKLEHFPVWTRRLLWLGFLIQLVGTLVDIVDNGSVAQLLGAGRIESIADLCAFLSLQFYVVGAITFVAYIAELERAPIGQPASSARAAAQPLLPPTNALGRRARLDMQRYIARGTMRGLFRSRLYVEGARPIMFLIRAGWCLWKFGGGIAAAGRPRSLQALDMLRLGWGEGVDPILYPTLELYRPERQNWADYALSRYEVGSGMLRRLHKLFPAPHGARVNLGDKLAFHQCCRAHGLPSPEILIHASGGELHWLEAADVTALDRDLFIKPRQSRGARNSMWLHRIAPFTWRTQYDETWSRETLIDELRRRSRTRDMLLQAMLVNHPAIANLAERSLIAIRVITGMDASGIPAVTHAMLRVLSKLEPSWNSKREYAAAIDLQSGVLGLMCNDKDLWPGRWTRHHPVTGAPVDGRLLTDWPETKALALAAHRVFTDRMLIGWDIALTPSGPVILEGNSYPDVHFLQRVHEQPIGLSRLAPLLQRALDAARVRDRHMIEG